MPRRQFTINNNCDGQIRLGATGGFVKSLTNPTVETCPDGSVLDDKVSELLLLPLAKLLST